MQRSFILDLFRIMAIALVFIAHFGQLLDWSSGGFFGIKNLYYVSLGGVGVSMFLILSGLLAGLVDSRREAHVGQYLLKKIARIYPLYWLSLPVAIAGYLIWPWLLDGDSPRLFPNGIWTDTIGSVTGFYSWAGLWGGPYNSPSWFIALIMTLYALFPLLLGAFRKQLHLTLVVLFIISLGSRYYVGQYGLPFSEESLLDSVVGYFYRLYGFMPGRPGDWFPLCRLFEFGFGIYLALVIKQKAWFALRLPCSKAVAWLSDLAFPLF